MHLLREFSEAGTTILVVTHDMQLVTEYAHRTIVVGDGRIVADAENCPPVFGPTMHCCAPRDCGSRRWSARSPASPASIGSQAWSAPWETCRPAPDHPSAPDHGAPRRPHAHREVGRGEARGQSRRRRPVGSPTA
ncbi:hypothetical protein [Microbacterium aurum]